jgi:DNA gyrase/topoisomerase IV subunit A
MTKVNGPEYINSIRKNFSIYILCNRAILSICDGLKPAARRVLWTARDGKKWKSASLAGATMPIHPHASPESTIDTLTAPYGNNYPLFQGYGAFGTLIAPDAYGASRYTSVALSQFSQDALMNDIEIIPMQENYDSSLMEPTHFLPIVPIGLLNPSEGIAIGYASSILPRCLKDVVDAQIACLNNQPIGNPLPKFLPLNQTAIANNDKWYFKGTIERVNTTTVKITSLPYGTTHAKVVTNENSKLNKLIEDEIIVDYLDNSKKQIDITVKFKRNILAEYTDEKLLSLFGLISNASDNLTVLNLTHDAVLQLDFKQYIEIFTQWRLTWFVKRYQRLSDIANDDMSRMADILFAIENNAGQVATTKLNKKDYCEWLEKIGIVNIEYIANLPTYRFTIEEKQKVEKQLVATNRIFNEYQEIIGSSVKQKNIYIKELQALLAKYG